MFIGHFAAGLAGKKLAPQVSLGTLFLAVQFVDLLWPVFLLLGFEHVRVDPGNTVVTPFDFYDYPLSHSLLGVMGWAVLFGGVYFLVRRNRLGALIGAMGVLSHWLLDFLVHRPDLPILPTGGPYVGLSLWNSLIGTIVVELGLFAAGVALYLRTTRATDRMGGIALWSLLTVLLIIQLGNYFGGPPPESVTAIAMVGLAQWLLVAWGYWVDRHREPVGNPPALPH